MRVKKNVDHGGLGKRPCNFADVAETAPLLHDTTEQKTVQNEEPAPNNLKPIQSATQA